MALKDFAATKNLMTAQQVADHFMVSPDTVRRWAFHKGLPCVRMGRQFFFDMEKVTKWLSE